jgi:Flp pilus assembly protein TadG
MTADLRTRGPSGVLLAMRGFARSQRGISAVEFALVLPILLTLFLGGTEITQGITIKRKVTIATRTIGDLVAQDVSITNGEMNSIFAATAAVLAPYSAGNLKIVVSSIGIDNNGAAKIVWSDASEGATARAVNEAVTLPAGKDSEGNAAPSLGLKNATLIWTETAYDYTPTIGYVVTGTMKLEDHVYLRPRLTNRVCRDNGAGDPVC